MSDRRQELTRDILISMLENEYVSKDINSVIEAYKNIFSVVNQSMSVYSEENISNKDFLDES
ncbi:hypothetical protein FDP51_05060 [Enterococcus mundtii]|uniref:hypothetical protein n=1 Tax=Enterococcus mundtii TaxID=53346 RepID=UPI00129C3F22|nr:hypothetical protein [Enterococcus mundtii]MRI73393.1 hypothetical protein [Enterococcus mundtii]